MQEIRPESLLMLAVIPIGFIAFVFFLIVGAIKYFKKKNAETELYIKISKQMNWNFSSRGEGLETTKQYFEYINRRILPDRTRLGTFPVNILWGNFQNALFSVFDFNYNNNPNSNIQNLRYEKGILIIANDLNLPVFEIIEKDIFQKGIEYVSGNSRQTDFDKNYRIRTNFQIDLNRFFGANIPQIFENSDIVRVLCNGKMFCIFFRRDMAEMPNLSRIQFQLNTAWQLAMNLR